MPKRAKKRQKELKKRKDSTRKKNKTKQNYNNNKIQLSDCNVQCGKNLNGIQRFVIIVSK